MWSWDKRKAQTLSPSSASRLEYSTLFTRNPSNQSHASSVHIPQHSRLSSSGIPWGYFTTRRPFTTPFTGTPSPASSDAISRTSPSGRVPDKVKNQTLQTYDRPLSQQHQHQYSKQKALTPTSWQSSLPVQHQHSKQAPIQKRIGRTKKDRSRYSHTETTQQRAPTENMSVNPIFEDSGSLRDRVTTRDKWSENKSNSAVRAEFVDNSIYKTTENGHLSDSDSISDVNSNPTEDDVNNFDQEIVKGEGVPIYATVFKNKQAKPAATDVKKPSSPTKKDEPVYSTIGDRKVEITKMDEQSSPTPVTSLNEQQHMQENSMSSFNLQSAKQHNKVIGQPKQNSEDTKQGKGLPQKKMSVLDELKLRFSSKVGLLKTTKQPSAETNAPNDTEPTRVKAESSTHTLQTGSTFNPAEVAPPPPPTAWSPQNHTDHQKDKQNPLMAPLSDTPPPPSFIPPPPPSKSIADAPQEKQEQIPSPDLTTETAGQTSQMDPVSSKTVLLSNMDKPKDTPQQDDDIASNPLGKDNAINVNLLTSQTGAMEDRMGNQSDTQDDSGDSSDGSSSYTTDSEYSSSQPSSAQAMDGRPKSILKNRYEKPLVNPEQLMPLSDSEDDDDNTSSQKGRTQDSNAATDDYASSSLDRRGVSFTRDTLDNEGTAKKYEKEGITMHKIDKNKELPSNFAIPKSTEENVPKPAAANDQELVQAEPVNVIMPRETLQPPEVSVAAEDVKIEENQEETTKQEEQVSPIPQADVVDGTSSAVEPEAPANAPSRYTFTPHVPEMTHSPKPNGITVLNGSLPTNSPPAVVSPAVSYHPKPKHPEMYFTLSRTGDNVSVVNISQDEAALDNMSQRLTMDRYSRDTLRSNISVGTLRTMISIGGASDLNDMEAAAYPGGNDDTLEHSLPFKVEMFEYKKKQTRTGKYQKKEPHGKQRSAKMLKKTTFADQALGYDAQIKKEKRKQKNRRICRVVGFVAVVVIILVTTVLIVYFLLENDQAPEEAVTATPN